MKEGWGVYILCVQVFFTGLCVCVCVGVFSYRDVGVFSYRDVGV